MKHAIIVGHPDSQSFTAALAERYVRFVGELGHDCVVRDLYRMGFDPRLQLSELPTRAGWKPAADVLAERQVIGDADVFAFIYPLWFNTPPAIVKGYIERVFGAGFGYAELKAGGRGALLQGRHLVHVSVSGSISAWLNEQGAWSSMLILFDDYLSRICGLERCPHIHLDGVTPGMADRWGRQHLWTLEAKLSAYFAPERPIRSS